MEIKKEIRRDRSGMSYLSTALPMTAARIVQPLLRETILFHRWPEMRFTTGFTAHEVSIAFAEIFGQPDPAIKQLAAAERADGRQTAPPHIDDIN